MVFFLSRSIAGPEVIPQAFDPTLQAQLAPAAVMPAILSLGMKFSIYVSPSSSLSPHSHQSKDTSHSWVLLQMLSGLHPQVALRNTLLDFTCTSSRGPGQVFPVAPC